MARARTAKRQDLPRGPRDLVGRLDELAASRLEVLSLEELLALIDSATTTLTIESMQFADAEVRSLVVTEPDAVRVVTDTFERDWAVGTSR